MIFDQSELASFIQKAAKATYAGGGEKEPNPERKGFIELAYSDGNFSYKDSYTGFYRSWGTETVRFKDNPVWISLYGGGMEKGKENLAMQTFSFLKKALSQKEGVSSSFRGPEEFKEGEWGYTYKQEGNISKFSGYEEIYFQKELVFTHKIIGGIVVNEL